MDLNPLWKRCDAGEAGNRGEQLGSSFTQLRDSALAASCDTLTLLFVLSASTEIGPCNISKTSVDMHALLTFKQTNKKEGMLAQTSVTHMGEELRKMTRKRGMHSQQQKAWIRTHYYVPEMLMKLFLGSKYCQNGGWGGGALFFYAHSTITFIRRGEGGWMKFIKIRKMAKVYCVVCLHIHDTVFHRVYRGVCM